MILKEASAMSWGVSKSIEELLQRLRSNDPSLTSLHIFQGKKFGNEVNIDILEDFTTQGLPPANLKFENLLCHSLCDKVSRPCQARRSKSP